MTQKLPKSADFTLPLKLMNADKTPLVFADVDNIIISFFRRGDRKRVAVAKLTGYAGDDMQITPDPETDGQATIEWKKEFTQDFNENDYIDAQMTLVVGEKETTLPPVEAFLLCENENINLT